MKIHFSFINLTVNFLLLIIAGYVLVNLNKKMSERQEIVADLAVVNDIRYGLFNVDKWKIVAEEVISKKINELVFDPKLNETLRGPVENAMYSMIDNIDKHLTEEKKRGNIINKAKYVVVNFFFDANKFKKEVPGWTSKVIKDINTPKNRDQVKKFLKEKLDEFLNDTDDPDKKDIYSYLTEKYNIEDYDECVAHLTEKSKSLSSESWRLTWVLIALVVIMFLIYFGTIYRKNTYHSSYLLSFDKNWVFSMELHYYVLLFSVILLLLGGLLTPMIDIDARILNLDFKLIGEPINFKDQVIFFQSKSVLDVVVLLIKEGDAQTIGVGILIFLFSIIFPVLKIIFSGLSYRFPTLIKKNKIFSFFVLESAKWSMTDVMVLAIFMSYIGFSSIVGSQLDFVSSFENAKILSTPEYTTLQMGFYIFTAYCISGIVFGYVAKKVLTTNNV